WLATNMTQRQVSVTILFKTNHIPTNINKLYLIILYSGQQRDLPSFPTRRSSDLAFGLSGRRNRSCFTHPRTFRPHRLFAETDFRSEEHTSELQSRENLVCRLLLAKNKKPIVILHSHVVFLR